MDTQETSTKMLLGLNHIFTCLVELVSHCYVSVKVKGVLRKEEP